MANKIIDTLLLLIGPVITALTQIWGLVLPEGLGELITSFLNLLLVIIGGIVTVFVGVPAVIRLAPRRFAAVFQQVLGK
jgi:hypothetical protein